MNFIRRISFLSLLLILPLSLQARDFSADKDYTKLAKPIATTTGDKIEVLEFFWYGCPHCFSLEPAIKKWKKRMPANVQLVRMPSPLNPRWMVHTKSFYALELMGEGEKHHDAIFSAMHVDKKRLYSKEAMADFVASRGVDKAAFLSNYDSFAVEMRARQALQLGQQYQVSGVPMLAVNGKYTIATSQGGSYDGLIKRLDYLLKKEGAK